MKVTVEDSATCLFNGVCLIWSEHINVAKDDDNIDKEEAAAREYCIQEKVITNIILTKCVVSDQELDDNALEYDEGKDHAAVLEFCVGWPSAKGETMMIDKTYLEIRKVAQKRIAQKKAVSAFILKTIKELKK